MPSFVAVFSMFQLLVIVGLFVVADALFKIRDAITDSTASVTKLWESDAWESNTEDELPPLRSIAIQHRELRTTLDEIAVHQKDQSFTLEAIAEILRCQMPGWPSRLKEVGNAWVPEEAKPKGTDEEPK